MATKAIAGKGTKLNINTGTVSTPVWTEVMELDDISPASKWETDEATNFDSSGVERIATMFDGGAWKVTGNRISSDTGQAAMQAAYASGALTMFQVVSPKLASQSVSGDMWAFSAILSEWNGKFSAKKKVPISGTLETSNGLVYTEGS